MEPTSGTQGDTAGSGALTITVRQERHADREMPVVGLSGELDISGAPRFNQAIIDLVRTGQRHIVIDMQDLTFLDSSGLSVLIAAVKRVRADGGSIRLAATNPAVEKILRVTGLHRFFGVHPTVAAALGAD